MAIFDIGRFAQKHTRALDWLTAFAIVAGIAALFLFDVSEPLGAADGTGYAALVALSIRFGRRSVLLCAGVTTILTIAAAFLIPKADVAITQMWANRGFAIAEIWIVAAILCQLSGLQKLIANRERRTEIQQQAIETIIREALVVDKPLIGRVQCITENCAEALGADIVAVLQGRGSSQTSAILDLWDRSRRNHRQLPDVRQNTSAEYRSAIQREFVAYADDVRTSAVFRDNLPLLQTLGIRSLLVGEYPEPGSGAIAIGFSTPHLWSSQEIAFGHSIANLVALVIAANRMAETLATIEQVSEGIYAEDANGFILYANRMAREMAGTGDANPLENVPRPTVALHGAYDAHEMNYRGRDLEIQRRRLFNGGIVTLIADVTDRNAALADRNRLEVRLAQGTRMEAIGQLAGGVAHDFNNILGSILGFAGFLAQDLPENSAEKGFAERILAACERGKDLVDQMLAFAQARTDKLGAVDLVQLLERNREAVTAIFPAGTDLRIALPERVAPVFGSKIHIERMISNLCINARDACDGETARIDISLSRATQAEIDRIASHAAGANEKIFGQIDPASDYCILRIADRGRGMGPEVLEHIFEPFFTTKGRYRSSGLGLAVVHGIVEAMKGACHLVSEAGKGTAFSIFLLCAAEGLDQPSDAADGPAEARGNERVLVVDDERDIADMLAIGLERLGYDTVGVTDPLEALAAFAEDPGAFDVVVTDQVMPGMRGLDLIRRVKDIEPGIKTIVCTGYSDSVNADIARQAGADAFFHKPVDARLIAPQIRLLMKAV